MAECPGLYHLAAMKDGGLARLRVVGQHLSIPQMEVICEASKTFGNGIVEITQRGNLQLRGLEQQGLERPGPAGRSPKEFLERFEDAKLLASEACDRIQNITIDPLTGLWPKGQELVDCQPLALALGQQLCERSAFHRFNVKFSFVLDGGSPSQQINLKSDVGARAFHLENAALGGQRVVPLEVGFQIYLAGRPTNLALEERNLVSGLAQIALVAYKLAGETPFRMRDLISARGDLLDQLASHPHVFLWDHRGMGQAPFKSQGRWLDQSEKEPMQRHMQAPFGIVELEGQFALCIQGASQRFQAGELAHFLSKITALGVEGLRLCPSKQFLILTKTRAQAEQVQDIAHKANFVSSTQQASVRLCACAGSVGCEKGKFETNPIASALWGALEDRPLKHKEGQQTLVHISACEKGCAYSGVADLLITPSTTGEHAFALHQNKALPEDGELPLQKQAIELACQSELIETITRVLRNKLKT